MGKLRFFAVLAQHPHQSEHGFTRLVIEASSPSAAVKRARRLRYDALGARLLPRRRRP